MNDPGIVFLKAAEKGLEFKIWPLELVKIKTLSHKQISKLRSILGSCDPWNANNKNNFKWRPFSNSIWSVTSCLKNLSPFLKQPNGGGGEASFGIVEQSGLHLTTFLTLLSKRDALHQKTERGCSAKVGHTNFSDNHSSFLCLKTNGTRFFFAREVFLKVGRVAG